MVRRTIRAINRTLEAIKVSRRIKSLYNPMLWWMVWRAHSLHRTGRFEPVEAFRLGLMHPSCPADAAARFVSRWELTRVQKALNPESSAPILKDKGLFYKRCTEHRLPIPKYYALIKPDSSGWCMDGSSINSVEGWADFLAAKMPHEFVIKPVSGTLSEGFDILTRCEGGFCDTKQMRWTAQTLASRLLNSGNGSGWRLKSHPAIVELSGSEYLQAVRVVTLIDRWGECIILFACIRSILGDEVSDNVMVDLSGSTELPIDLTTGMTGPAVRLTGDGLGPRIIQRHPKTGRSLSGFFVPRWDEVCTLVKTAASYFLPIRSIGWDVGVTSEGAFLLEGNIWWNNGKKHAGFRQIVERMRCEI